MFWLLIARLAKKVSFTEKIQNNINEFYRWSMSHWNDPQILPEDLYDDSQIIKIRNYGRADNFNSGNNLYLYNVPQDSNF